MPKNLSVPPTLKWAWVLIKDNLAAIIIFALIALLCIGGGALLIALLAKTDAERSAAFSGLVSGFVANCVFFLIFGIAFALVVSADPNRLSLHARLQLIFSSSKTSPEAQSYLLKEIAKLGATLKSGTARITFSELNKEQSAVRVRDSRIGVISNWFTQEYYSQDLKVVLVADNVSLPEGATYAEISSASYTTEDQAGISRTNFIATDVKQKQPGELSRAVSLNIPPGKSVSLSSDGYFWQDLNQEMFFLFRQFVEELEFKFINNLDREVVLLLRNPDSDDHLRSLPKEIRIPADAESSITINDAPPAIRLLFKVQIS